MVRTIVLLGPPGSGRSTLLKALLTSAEVDGGGSADHAAWATSPLAAATVVASLSVHGVRLTLLNPRTSGTVDLAPRAALSGADAAVFVVSAVAGLDHATRLLWQECEAIEMPRVIVLTHVDDPRADPDEALEACQEQLGEGLGIHALHLPMLGDDGSVAGLIDLVRLRIADHAHGDRRVRPAEQEHVDLVEDERTQIVEAILAEAEDDDLLPRFVAGEELDADVLASQMHAAISRGHLHPVLVSAITPAGCGAAELAEVMAQGSAPLTSSRLPMVTSPRGEPRDPLSCAPDAVLCAGVLGLIADPSDPPLAIVRMFSGTLHADSAVTLSRQGAPAEVEVRQVRMIHLPLGARLHRVDWAVAGDIALVAGLSGVRPGDTLSSPDNPLLLEEPAPPPTTLAEPVAPPSRDRSQHRMLPIVDVQARPRD